MKHTIVLLAFLTFSINLAAQDGFKLGLQAGLPFNDFNNAVSVVVGVDAGYMWALGESVDMGVASGLIYGFHETFQSDVVVPDLPDLQFVPTAVTFRVWPSRSVSLGGDVGYAFGLNDINEEGGFYYRPILAYLWGPTREINISYTTIQLDGKSWNTVTMGLLFTLNSGIVRP